MDCGVAAVSCGIAMCCAPRPWVVRTRQLYGVRRRLTRRSSVRRSSAVPRLGGELGAVGHAELRVHVREMRLDRAAAHVEPGADLRVGEAVDGEPHHLALGGRETVPAV